MRYQDARPNIKSGDVIAFTHRKWGSFYDLQIQAVRFFTQSEYSHVALVWEIGGRLFLIESVVPLIRIVPLSMFAEEGFYHLPMHCDMSDAELEFALSEVGKGQYSKWQAILAQVRGIKVGADALWECAEFVIASRRESGIDLGPKATPSAVVQKALDRTSLTYIEGA